MKHYSASILALHYTWEEGVKFLIPAHTSVVFFAKNDKDAKEKADALCKEAFSDLRYFNHSTSILEVPDTYIVAASKNISAKEQAQ